jgi:hypothetical protein
MKRVKDYLQLESAMEVKAENILAKYDEDTLTLGLRLREFLLSQLEDCLEMPDTPANIIAYGYGPGYTDLICTIIPSKKGIKLGFNRGSEFDDPKKLLRGSGKVHRYVEIKSEKDFHSTALKQLIKQGFKACKKRKNAKPKK